MSKSNKNLDIPKRIKVVGKKKNRFKYKLNDFALDAISDYDSEFSLEQHEDFDEKNYIS